MTGQEISLFNSLKRYLKKNLPSPAKCRIVLAPHLADEGETTLYKDGHFVIRIDASLKYGTIIDTLIHEWAHVLTLQPSSIKEHPQSYWVSHGKIYECFEKWRDKHEIGV